MLQKKVPKSFYFKGILLQAHNKFDLHKKKYVPEVYHVYKHANQHGMK